MDQLAAVSVLPILFIGSTALAIYLFLKAVPDPRAVAVVVLAWLALQGSLALSGFFTETHILPPRMILAIGPPLITAILLLLFPEGRRWLIRCDLRTLTLLHIVRIPVEFGLHHLYLDGLVPQLMTFEGLNFDIFSGVTAPLVAMLAFGKNRVNRPLLLTWNIICLLLLLNIVFHGILSVPSPFQQFGFEQPNIGLLVFPYQWLPSMIVPLVLLAHLAAILQLTGRETKSHPQPV